MPETRTIKAPINFGHGEYLPTIAPQHEVAVWDPYTEENYNWLDVVHDDDAIAARYTGMTGMLPTDWDTDLSWQHVSVLEADEGTWIDWYDDMLRDVGNQPSGDDDTFDYWPSGCRALVQMAEVLDTEIGHGPTSRVTEARATIQRILGDMDDAIRQDIEHKVGLV